MTKHYLQIFLRERLVDDWTIRKGRLLLPSWVTPPERL